MTQQDKHSGALAANELDKLDELSQHVEDIISQARKKGADAADAVLGLDSGLSVNVRMGELETVEHHKDRGMSITVYLGKKKGSASTADLSPAALADTVEKAIAIARQTEEDPCHGLPPHERMPKSLAELDNWHPWNVSVDEACEMALEAEEAGMSMDKRIHNSEGAQVSTVQGISVYGNSHGFIGHHHGTRHSISCVLLARDENGMQRDYWYDTKRKAGELSDARSIGLKAAERTIGRLNSRKPGTSKNPVLFAPEMARGMLRHFISAISGGNLYRKSTFLLDSLGEQVFPDFFHLYEQPHLPVALGSANFDSDGIATEAKDFVRDGKVSSYLMSWYSACRLGMQATGNADGTHNLTLTPGSLSFEDLLKEMGNGLVVTELMGQGVNITNGDYSRGASGYWVENGEIVYPVEEITIASNLKDMFASIRALGNDVDTRASTRCGSILVDGMTIAGS